MPAIDILLQNLSGDAPVERVLVGAFWVAVVLATDPPRCGLASTLLHGDHHHDGPPLQEAGRLSERSARELAELLRSTRTLEASVGMAALNALLEVDEATCTEVNAEEVILTRGAGRRVAVVGHFPFVQRVRPAAAECWVLEQYPGPGDLPASEAPRILPQADVIALTGTSLINHTFDDLIHLCRSDAYVLLLGPSTPLTPALFDTGVDALSGTLVDDPARVLRTVGQGGTFGQIKRGGGLRLLTMERSAQTSRSGRP